MVPVLQMWGFAAFPLNYLNVFFYLNNTEVWTVGWTKQIIVKVSLWALGNCGDISHCSEHDSND